MGKVAKSEQKSQKPGFLPILRLNEALRPFGRRLELVHTTEGDLLGLCIVETGERTDYPSETQFDRAIGAIKMWQSIFSSLETLVAASTALVPANADRGHPHEQGSGKVYIDKKPYGPWVQEPAPRGTTVPMSDPHDERVNT